MLYKTELRIIHGVTVVYMGLSQPWMSWDDPAWLGVSGRC